MNNINNLDEFCGDFPSLFYLIGGRGITHIFKLNESSTEKECMKYEKRTNKNGKSYFSFVHYDTKTKKTVRITRKEIRERFGKDITTEEEAKACAEKLKGKFELEKIKIERRLEWQNLVYPKDPEDPTKVKETAQARMIDQYTTEQKNSAPNSWENNVFYLKHYVLYYFLQIENIYNVELWPLYYDKFRTFLETAKTIRSGKPIAYQSKNHAIKSLNTFMTILGKKKLISKVEKCDTFGEHLMNGRSIDDVIHPNEMEKVYKILIEAEHLSEAYLFRYLFFSGMRFSEALAVSIPDFYKGEINGFDFLVKKLKVYNIKYYGYISADSQFGGMDGEKVIRLPFKGKKKITRELTRIIPIADATLWNDLTKIRNQERQKALTKKSVPNRNCLFFANIDDTTATNRLKWAFEKAKLRYRSWHCLRHSRATWLIGETADTELARIWLGHKSPRTIEKYNHIYGAIVDAAKSKDQSNEDFDLVKP